MANYTFPRKVLIWKGSAFARRDTPLFPDKYDRADYEEAEAMWDNGVGQMYITGPGAHTPRYVFKKFLRELDGSPVPDRDPATQAALDHAVRETQKGIDAELLKMKARQQGEALLRVTGLLPLDFINTTRAAMDPKNPGHDDAVAAIDRFLAQPSA